MRLSFLTPERGNSDLITLEVNLDFNYDQLLNMVHSPLGLKKGKVYDLTIDGKTYTKADIDKVGSLKGLNLKENDLVILAVVVKVDLIELSDNEQHNLIRSIHIPASKSKLREEVMTSRDGYALYRQLQKASENQRRAARRQFERTYPGLLDQFERRPNDKWAFLITYRNSILKMNADIERRGQVAVQERLDRKADEERLEQNFHVAMEETPEALIPVEMLFIKIRLNGVDGHAFIDTGAAKSLISRDYVERCGLSSLINRDHVVHFRGVGGTQASDGTIWKCDMVVENHEFPVTLYVVPNECAAHEVLLGLDILLRHRCLINLQDRSLTLNNEATTHFLSPSEAAVYSQQERAQLHPDEDAEMQAALEESTATTTKGEPMDTDQK